jgi:hypothetical protein
MHVPLFLLPRAAAAARALYPSQILDATHPDVGGIVAPDDSAMQDEGCTIFAWSWLACAGHALLWPESPLAGDAELRARIGRHIAFAERQLSPEGLADLVATNWRSPPDTAFAIEALAPVVALARRHGDPLAEPLGALVRRMAEGVAGRGFHTPNHRWVVCGALGAAMRLFPDLDARPYVESILAETVDCNADGEFIERSAGAYNAICDRALILAADFLNRPDLLDAVRRNLELVQHLFHADMSVVTTFSGRQDHGRRIVPVALAEAYGVMGRRDGRGDWLAIANQLAGEARDCAQCAALLRPFAWWPELRMSAVAPTAVPDAYRRHFPVAGLWRVRRGPLSATAGAATPTVFALEYGPVRLPSLSVATSYFGAGTFIPRTLEPLADGTGVRLANPDCNPRAKGVYQLPLGRPVGHTAEAFAAEQSERETWSVPRLGMTLDIVEVQGGFDLRLRTESALPRIPVQIELAFAGPGIWETDDTAIPVGAGQTALLRRGLGTFHREGYGISVEPGSAAHRMWAMRGTQPDAIAFRVLIALEHPVDAPITLRYGPWSPAQGGLLDS